MEYNKDSFLAGRAVGRTLKGWASSGSFGPGGGGGGEGGKLSDIIVRSQNATYIEVPAEGFYGIGSVTVEGDEDLLPENIKKGVTILGVEGSYAPSQKLMAGSDTITKNGTYTYYPSSGYVGLSRYTVTVDVPTEVIENVVDAIFQSKSVTPTTYGQSITPDEGYNALSSVYVAGDSDLVAGNIREGVTIFGVTGTYSKTEVIDAVLQSKSVTPGRNSQTIYPDSGYNALSSVYIAGDGDLIASNIREGVSIFGVEGSYSSGQNYQNKTVTPTAGGFTVTSDSGYNALAQVIVKGDPNLTPSKIAAGATIFGVTGTYVSPMTPITVIPGEDEQLILPAEGFAGFSSITVAPAGIEGEYSKGFSDGAASRDEEVAILREQIVALQFERDRAYENGYNAGYADGAADTAASYKNLDEEEF